MKRLSTNPLEEWIEHVPIVRLNYGLRLVVIDYRRAIFMERKRIVSHLHVSTLLGSSFLTFLPSFLYTILGTFGRFVFVKSKVLDLLWSRRCPLDTSVGTS